MGQRYRPLTCKEVIQILQNLDFSPPEGKKDKRGSHQNWKKVVKGRLYKVTVDCPKAPFSQDLIRWMAEQAGLSKKNFYKALDKKEAQKLIKE